MGKGGGRPKMGNPNIQSKLMGDTQRQLDHATKVGARDQKLMTQRAMKRKKAALELKKTKNHPI